MKKLLIAAILSLLAFPVFSQEIFGTWKTIPDDNNKYGHIQISACGAKICGVLIKSFNGDGSEYESANIGRKLVWDMVSDGGGNYSGGKVYSPDRDKTYKGKMVLSGNKLDVKGCVGPFCRSGGTWTRVK